MVTPAAKRQAVAHLCSQYEVSQRRACSAIGVDRTSVRYCSRRSAGDVMELERRPGDILLVERNNPIGLSIRYLCRGLSECLMFSSLSGNDLLQLNH